MKKVFVLLAMVSLFGCTFQGGRLDGDAPDETVALGSTEEIVEQTLGRPGFVETRGRAIAWQYCSTGLINDTYQIVWFVDGAVAAFSKQNASMAEGFCDQAYPPVNWSARPPAVLL